MPHSLGHYLGLYTHDVGACKFPEDNPKYAGVPHSTSIKEAVLEPGMCCTNEPGIYFMPLLINKYKNDAEKSGFFNWDLVEAYTPVGGVRIEDDLVITKDGHEVYHELPRTCDEIESFMATGEY